MRYQILTILASALLIASQDLQTQLASSLKPFQFKVLSNTNTTLNNSGLFPCHVGAALETLCWTSKPVSPSPNNISTGNTSRAPPFAFNSTMSTYAKVPSIAAMGPLLYNLTFSNGWTWQPLNLNFDYSSNLASPMFGPGGTRNNSNLGKGEFGFDESGLLVMWSYRDDSNTAWLHDWHTTSQVQALNRWYICDTVSGNAYRYTTLAWLMGSGAPQNPTCQFVNVTRVFADSSINGYGGGLEEDDGSKK